jgi:hypothetical protein
MPDAPETTANVYGGLVGAEGVGERYPVVTPTAWQAASMRLNNASPPHRSRW